ncbi:MAG: winged helix-turn-helix transcriptional regulator [Candidatus Lokiarchaeota archaeon]|nr:winged helix-turn-helix transcriptional regulator [Candidatus Lokiarchaeota archaeon]
MLKKKSSFAVVGVFLFILLSCTIHETIAIDIFGNKYVGYIEPYESIYLDFVNFNKEFSLTANTSVNFSIQHFSPILDRQISMIINDSDPIEINISFSIDIGEFLSNIPKDPQIENLTFIPNYYSVLHIVSNNTIDNLSLIFQKSSLLGIDPEKNYSIAYCKSEFSAWQIIPTEDQGNNVTRTIKGEVLGLKANEDYFITIYNVEFQSSPPPGPVSLWVLIVITSVLILIVITISLVISKEEYIRELKNWLLPGLSTQHNLSLEEVLENENRDKIIDLVLNEPGIHFNELLRKTSLSPGNLAWHLDVLESYKIIKKERVAHFLVYFPYYQKNPISNIELKLQKSELTFRILQMINEDPGMWNNKITEKLEVNRKTIAYHIEKLKELDLIEIKKQGRKKKIFPKNLDHDDDIIAN